MWYPTSDRHNRRGRIGWAKGVAWSCTLFVTATLAPISAGHAEDERDQGVDVGMRLGIDEGSAWVGRASERLERLATALSNIAADFPDDVAGVALSSDYRSVDIYVKNQDSEAKAALVRAVGDDTDVVEFRAARFSESDYLDAMGTLEAGALERLGYIDIGPDFIHDRLTATVSTAVAPGEVARDYSALASGHVISDGDIDGIPVVITAVMDSPTADVQHHGTE